MKRNSSFIRFAAVVLAAFLSAQFQLRAAELNVLELTEVDSAALNFSSSAANFSQNVNGRTYQRSPVSSFKGYQYATYYDGNRNVCLGRRKLPSGPWEVIRFPDYSITSHDSHNITALGICAGDGTIHLAFDHHKHPLNYRVSSVGVATNPDAVSWSASLFGSVTDELGSVGRLTDVTYPSFFQAPNGNLMLFYRFGGSGNGDGMIYEYDGSSSDWSPGMGKFISRSGTYNGAVSSNSTSRNPYINGISYGGDRLHASWGWRESSGGSQFNHDLNYAYSDDDGRTWRNSAGTQIGVTGSSFISIHSSDLIVAPIPQNIGLSNQYTHYAYPDGSCHVVVAHREGGTGSVRYHHYWRNAAGTWSSEVLPLSGSRPKLVGDENRELFLVYVSGNTLRVAKGTPNASETAWSWSSIHSQSDRSEGGEGQIDVARWEADRILSVYGQEDPPSNGSSTALHVLDYQVSAKAILPLPAHEQSDVDIAISLEWTGGIDADMHRVYLGTDRAAVEAADPSSPEFQGEQVAASFTPTGPLAKDTTYYWRVDEVDSESNVHSGLIWSFTTSPDFLPGDVADASVKEDPSVTDVSSQTTLLGAGGSSPWVDRCTVYVFQLPDLGAVADPFLTASFRFNMESKQGSLMDNDLYGLGRRSSPEVLASDYYGQTSTGDPTDATRLEAGILTDATPLGAIRTSAGGDSALLDYLNEQYDSGAGIGEYVFLRLNTAEPKAGINRATLTMAESGDEGSRPRIVYSSSSGPTVTMVVLGSPEDLTDGATWSDGLPAHPGSHYVVPDTGNLRGEAGSSTFPGISLTVEKGGRFQVRSKEDLGELTTVDQLILSGGSSYASGNFVELTAGTGSMVTNVLDGVITNSGFSRFLSYGVSGGSNLERNLKVHSRIDGSGRIQAREGSAAGLSSVIITHPANGFSGTWEVAEGSALIFENAGAVGTADIEVAADARLEIQGHWTVGGSLSVADTAATEVDLGSFGWVVEQLTFGSLMIPSGTYGTAELNAFGSNAVFTGSGALTVIVSGEGGPVARWALDEGNGILASDSSGNGQSGELLHGATWGSDATRDSFVVLDGVDDRITTPFAYALSAGDDFTWAWWANRAAGNHSGAIMVGNRFPEGPPGERFEFIKFTAVEAQFADVEEAGSIAKHPYAEVSEGEWHHYAMVKTGTSYQWYVDGVPQGAPLTHAYSESSPIPFQIGGDDNDGTPGGKENEHFEGMLDDVVLYDRALTAVELGSVMGGGYADLPQTWQENWRQAHFGTRENSGIAADDFDANSDGEDNLLEFATGQDPFAATLASTPMVVGGENIEFRYRRSKAALADGVAFQVEWSDTMTGGSWSTDDTVDESDPENPDTAELEFRRVLLPGGSAGRRFCRLRVTAP
ncbi:BNR-4 repeat-containing protein [Haloferula rosea]|uniref:BNR-4 repeat-containing protein n=1 Tax=Haloferula rosea TaxID=490093 RepID=A0A934R533_9BACT|nr:BNR-4 repeat-containing protein [Haloferula rosea]MBK1825464.1 BNR-4 repeat-containing protein [Haloferula rosea]